MESDMYMIIGVLKYDEGVQDLFIPKFKVLMKDGIDKKRVQNAYKEISSGGKAVFRCFVLRRTEENIFPTRDIQRRSR